MDGTKGMRQIILELLEYSSIGHHENGLEDIDLNELVKEFISL